MQLVADANVLLASFIRRGVTQELLLEKDLALVTPEFVLSEIEEHRGEALEKSGKSAAELDEFLDAVRGRVRVVPEHEVRERWQEAKRLSPDPDDVPYFALALKLGCAIWSNDRRLKGQKQVKVLNTSELLKARERGP